ncbi:hypothetical protein DYU05_20580 [Mucilaginibacter terrenus]|uniref:Uncharacterized protein n=1 Tax=Mucilaginibacter terrenus TaxID=2482727 RepID=A0A3E2NJH5_9SPHI|nr:hypothetical protein [Mucilaginibacter terrenus]RFZ81156.1 hypothetical protein DYU05_20580 [Mucilaginibacter terrenus]
MKEVSEINKKENSNLARTRKSKIGKRWKQIKPRSHPNNYYQTVRVIINNYLRILEIVKTEYLQLGERFFEKDLLHDPSDPFTLYKFFTTNFYWYLECDLLFNMNIYYTYNDCPYDYKVNDLISRYTLAAIPKRQHTDLDDYMKGTIGFQGTQLIFQKKVGEDYSLRSKMLTL